MGKPLKSMVNEMSFQIMNCVWKTLNLLHVFKIQYLVYLGSAVAICFLD